ncbi:MAG: carboxypeptidase regulatory-like domain-containing protein [Acidobacteriaceae bacterium]
MRALGLRSVRWAGLAVLLCGLAAWGQAYTPVTVVVTDPSGAGVSGAEILVTPGSPSGDRLITDEHGRAQLGMPAGEYKLHIAAQGFMTADQKLSVADKAQTVNVTLQPGKPTSGGVVNPGATPLQPSAVPLESTVEKPHAESASEAEPAATLVIEGMDGQRGVFTAATLKEYPHQTVTIFDHHTNAKETYSGVPLMELLAHLGVPHGKELMGKALGNYVVATGSDGYKSVVALGEIDPEFHPGMVLVADTMDGKPLGKAGPFRLVVSEDKRPARSVRNLVRVEVRMAE